MKRQRLHINEKDRGVVVRNLKSLDWDRIRIFVEVACTGMRMKFWAQRVNRISRVHSLFRTEGH
jgi:hypothetical protein